MNDLASIFSRNWLGHVAEYNNELNVVIQNYTGNPGAQFVLANDQIVNVFERIVPRYEAQVDDRVTGVPSSFERLALLSFAWNNADLIGPNMQSYIADGDRTSVWFDMRYKNNGGASRGGGIAKRRYLEAQIFGLYEPGVTAANISQESALKVYQVLTKNRTTVFDYEHEFSSYIDNANNDYGAFFSTVADSSRDGVDTLEVSLTTAGDALKNKFLDAAENPENTVVTAESIGYLDIQVTDAVGGTLTGSKRDNYNLNSTNDAYSDLLIGQDAKDVLKGLGGNDALFGQGSDDTLEGGDGDDYLVGRSGEDILQGDGGGDILLGGAESDTYRVSNGDKLIDEDGNGEVYWDNVVITGGSRKEGDPANTYYSEDKSYTYFLSNGELTVKDSAGGVITIKNYSERKSV